MRKYIFFISALVALGGAGCSSDFNNYQCKSNDECLVGSEGQTSCALDTSKCVAVTPITVTGTWKTPKVGQTNFSVELDAGGGHPPYSWEVAIVDKNGKLSWLTYQTSEDTKTTLLINKVENDKPVPPQEAAELSEGLKIKVTVRDNTKQGEKDRIDNKGAVWETMVAIEECPSDLGCVNDDGCCPADCTIGNDSDCPTKCGDGIVTSPPETCDTKITSGIGACPTSCDDSDGCTIDTTTGSTENCDIKCAHELITLCKDNDGCCPDGCTTADDNDCTCKCNNGVVEPACSETCDTAIPAGQAGACPTSCTAPNACTTSALQGAGTCKAKCVNTPITPCCGNGVVETSENCDTGIAAGQTGACPTSCTKPNACTSATLQNAGTCTAFCSTAAITTCVNGDGCCPSSCTHCNDTDCSTVCGDGCVSGSETCDGNCPTSCDDGVACTADALQNGGTCTATCTHTPITACQNGDGCCPSGCVFAFDSDCPCSAAYTSNCSNCATGALGIHPYCFLPTSTVSTYCLTSQCFPVTPTGQTSCYNATASESCSDFGSPPNCSLDFCGQDAQYPDRSRNFTCSIGPCGTSASANDVITDSLTGLMWQRTFVSNYSWQQAIDYCSTLNYAGHDDWRLPNPIELQSLVNYNTVNPAIDTTAFPNMPLCTSSPYCYFWSSSSYVYGTSYAWGVYFSYGGVSSPNKPNTGYVRCVRGGT